MKYIILFCVVLVFSVNAEVCYEKLCKNDFVIDQYGYRGTVEDINVKELTVDVLLDHIPAIYTFPYTDLGKLVNCYLGICTKDKVLDPYQDEVQVVEVYDNDMARVFDFNRDYLYTFKVSELTPLKGLSD